MEKRKKALCIVLCLLMCLSILTSCSGSTNNAAKPSASAPKSSAPAGTGSASASAAKPAGTERSRTVKIGTGYKPTTMDPHDLRNWSSTVHAFFVFSTLIWSDHKGEAYKPLLAKSWEIAPDGKSWTFKLRDDVKFSNGDKFTADDVVYSVQRVCTNDKLVYKTFYAPTLQDAVKIDDYTVKVNFKEPFADAGGAFVALFIINSKSHKEMGDALFSKQVMNGTGPWILDQWIDGQFSKFHKNPNYFDKANYDSYFSNVELDYIAEPSSAIAAHLSGTIDMYAANGGVSMDQVPLYKGTENKIDLVNYETCTQYTLGFSFKAGSPWLDDKLREAFDLCIDRQTLIDTVFGKTGATMPVGAVHKVMRGYNEALGKPKYDPARAKELVSQSTYKGAPIELMIHPSIVQGEECALAIADMCKAVGINLTVKTEEFATFTTRQNQGQYDTFLLSVSSSDGNPYRTYEQYLQDYNKPAIANWPKSNQFFDLIKETMGAKGLDTAKRDGFAKQINEFMFANRMPRLVLIFKNMVQAQQKGITGINYWPDGLLDFSRVNWDPSKAAK